MWFWVILFRITQCPSYAEPFQSTKLGLSDPVGTHWNLWWEYAALFFKPLLVFRPKYAIFNPQFHTWPFTPFQAKITTIYALCQTSRKNIPNLRPKCSKSIPIFRPKRLKTHTLWGGTCLYSLYRWVPPPPPGPDKPFLPSLLVNNNHFASTAGKFCNWFEEQTT